MRLVKYTTAHHIQTNAPKKAKEKIGEGVDRPRHSIDLTEYGRLLQTRRDAGQGVAQGVEARAIAAIRVDAGQIF